MSATHRCPDCGADLPAGQPLGLCPRCALSSLIAQEKTSLNPVLPAPQPGNTIGRYKLLQKIGEGGMGEVWMAEQSEPIRRKVALKVIKLGMDTRSVIARFEAERQALALMDHPNIAKVFDAGATENGRPYFVMELVRGVKITDYCDQHNLATRARLDLFTQVCHAIQHAHHKGIIHRDIKPSNILVTLHDGVPVPKVIDFGIAKATSGQQLTDKTLFTAFDQFMGTPAYMSPEQAEMSGLDIDMRSDIYSLGVLLYELLTGKTPFDAKELLAAGFNAMVRTIREQEPARPSTRLSTMTHADVTAIASRRQTEPGKLTTLLRGDLDWIVMKALEKDRARRYETAGFLAHDVARHLKSEPVLACPPSALYRAQKFVHRHRRTIRVAGIVAAVLMGIGLPIALINRHSYQKRVAALSVKADAWDYQRPVLRSPKMQEAMFQTAEAHVQSTTNFTRVRTNSTAAYTLGQSYERTGRFAEAEQAFRQHLRLLDEEGQTNDRMAMNGLSGLSHALQGQGKFSETEPVLRQYLAILSQYNPDSWMTNKVKARLGCVLLAQKKYQEAEPILLQGYAGMIEADRNRSASSRSIGAPLEQQTVEWIVRLYTEMNRTELVDEWAKKLPQRTNSVSKTLP
jgi:serine/threonine protein kinase